MIVLLRQRDRTFIGAAGCLLCVLAGVVAPRSAAAVGFPAHVEGGTRQPNDSGRAAQRAVAIVRDPFVADMADHPEEPARTEGGSFAAIPGIPVLPPNRAVAVAPAPNSAAHIVVRAIVAGAHPSALVEIAGQSVLVRPGDLVLGKRVEAIDLGGVLLAGNIRLELQQ